MTQVLGTADHYTVKVVRVWAGSPPVGSVQTVRVTPMVLGLVASGFVIVLAATSANRDAGTSSDPAPTENLQAAPAPAKTKRRKGA